MPELPEASLIAFFTQYAYFPLKAYGLVVFFMLACAVILPFPEEGILLIAGLVAYSARNPDIFPPPYAGAEGISTFTMCLVCYMAVLLSDILIYFTGKYFGGIIIPTRFFQKRFAGKRFDRINSLFQQHGGWASGLFRFTPGFRFPGHLSCGFLGIPFWKFATIDAIAALIFVVPQVYFFAIYGNVVIENIQTIKQIVFFLIIGAVIIWLLRGFLNRPGRLG